MTRRIIVPRAARQIDQIHAYIAQNDEKAARDVLGRIHEVLEYLTSYPRSGRKTAAADVSMFAVSPYPYLVFFRYFEARDELQIVAVRHGARRRAELQDAEREFRT